MTQIEELSKHIEDNLHALLTEVRKELELADKKNTEIAELKKETEEIKQYFFLILLIFNLSFI